MWWQIAFFLFTLALTLIFRPKPQNAKPAGLEDFTIPTAEAGREIPVLFGTRVLKGPNVVWYGHLRTVAVKKKGGKK